MNKKSDKLENVFFYGEDNEFTIIHADDEIHRAGNTVYRSREIDGKRTSYPMRVCGGEYEAIMTEMVLKAVFSKK